MLAQTAVFTRLVCDHMGPPPLLVAVSDSCRVVVERLRSMGASEVIVSDEQGRALGIVTEQDISRRIACEDRDDSAIESVMSSPVLSISATALLANRSSRCD
jgi:signal-transduction protein with cAMP-binding, CBS, and nucleotidyltransferase domain